MYDSVSKQTTRNDVFLHLSTHPLHERQLVMMEEEHGCINSWYKEGRFSSTSWYRHMYLVNKCPDHCRRLQREINRLELPNITIECGDIEDVLLKKTNVAVVWLDHNGSALQVSKPQLSNAVNALLPDGYLAITTSLRLSGGEEKCKSHIEGLFRDHSQLHLVGHYTYGGGGPMLYTMARMMTKRQSPFTPPVCGQKRRSRWFSTVEVDYDVFKIDTIDKPSSRPRCNVTAKTKKWACMSCGKVNDVGEWKCRKRKCDSLRIQQGVPVE